jgi:putative ABC transport system permease protein
MSLFSQLRYRLRAITNSRAAEQELDREVSFHIEQETARNIALGMTREAARRKARLAFGSVENAKELHRDGRGARWLDDFIGDARLALRSLRRNPGFAIAAILTLTLGIGANVAIFTAVNAVLLRPLPFAQPNRLVMLWEENPERGWVLNTAAPANMLDWRENVSSFQDVGAYASFTNSATLTGAGEPSQHATVLVTGNLFRVLGVTPAAGQLFRDEETWQTGEQTVMITHRLWRTRFNADPSLPGKTITLNGRDVRVTGVLPADFSLPEVDVDIWRPTAWNPAQRAAVQFRRGHFLRPIARLRPGASIEQANAELQVVIARLQRDYPETNTKMGGGLTPLHEFLIGESRRPLLILLAAVGALLLIACANVGNLLLVQASARAQETALRLALGAKRSRLVRQALTESLVLAAIGGFAGCVMGIWSTKMLAALSPAGLLPTRDLSVNGTVLMFVAGITIVSSVLFGLAPVMWSRTRAPAESMREGGRGGSDGRRTRRTGETLLVAEVALALVLTLGAGLLIRSFRNVEHLDAGLNADRVLTAKLSLPGIRYDSIHKVLGFWERLRTSAGALPDAQSAGAVSVLPLTISSWSSDFAAQGWDQDRFGVDVVHRDVLPGYFETMGVRLIRGRTIDATDQYTSNRVVVINDEIAHRYFPNEDPVGQRIAFDRHPDSTSVWRTIVGVVASERQAGLVKPARPEIFEATTQRVSTTMVFVIRTRGNPLNTVAPLRRLVAELDPNLALADVRTMSDVRGAAAAGERFITVLLSAFALVGLALAVIGVYGVMARVTRGRSREMGIRMALGARSTSVRWLVVRRGLALTGAGVAAGLAIALIATRAMEKLLYGVTPFDPMTFVLVPVLLASAAVAACWLPAARVSRTSPMRSLRTD